MTYRLSCPSKTFLLGEYLVLNNGSALVMNTEPRFEIHAHLDGSGLISGLVPESPAGQWLRQNKLLFKSIDVDFVDQHHGVGGFGASSAQFLLTHLLTQLLKSGEKKVDFDVEGVWRSYRQLETVSQEGLRPSGADLVAQFLGGISEFQAEPFSYKRWSWPFTDDVIILAHTGHKIATHEHLRGLKRVHTEELEWIYARAMEMFSRKEAGGFFDSMNDYYAELLELGLVSENTQVLVTTLLSKPFIRAAKGCGAMGNDVVAIGVAEENYDLAMQLIKDLQLLPVADTRRIATGFEWKSEPTRPRMERLHS